MSINAETWTPVEVADWVAGLGSTVDEKDFASYSESLLHHAVNGKLLINLSDAELIQFGGVTKVGDQLLLAEAIQSLRSELDAPRITLQSLASALAVRCRNFRSELSLLYQAQASLPSCSRAVLLTYIPTESLTSASYLLESSKTLIRWLTRFPFLGNHEYDEITVLLTKHCFELAMLSQRDAFADNAIEEVQYLCTKLIEICEGIIHSKDSLVIQPAAMDVITLRKRTEQELGLCIESSYFGVHQISSVKLSSPAQQSGHLEKGDEILQINYQTVIGWPQQNVINLLTEDSNQVILTIKRRPRHATTNMLAHMYLRPMGRQLLGSTHRSHKRHSRHGADKLHPPHLAVSRAIPSSSLTLPHNNRPQKSIPISPVPEDERSTSSSTSSSANSPIVLVDVNVSNDQQPILLKNVASISNSSGGEDSISKPPLITGQSLDTLDSDDMAERSPGIGLGFQGSGSGSGSDSHSTSNKSPSLTSAQSRFWKLYPRPRNLIKRRATVTGASPTNTRPPVTFFDDDNSDSGGKLRPPLINSKSAPEKIRIGLRKQGHVADSQATTIAAHRKTMPPSLSVDAGYLLDTNYEASGPSAHSDSDSSSADTVEETEQQLDEHDEKCRIQQKSESDSATQTSVPPSPAPVPRKMVSARVIQTSQKESLEGPVTQQKPVPAQRKFSNPQPVPFKRSSSSTSPDNDANIEISTEVTENNAQGKDPTIILQGVLHLRQSPTNLLVKSNSLTSTLGSAGGTGFSPHPRWTRHPAILNSAKLLQIGSDPLGCLKLNLGEDSICVCEVSLAKEVHSRPFAFKVDVKPRTKLLSRATAMKDTPFGIFYLAAESQQEFETWIRHLMKPEVCASIFRTPTSAGMKDLMYQKLRSSAPPVYKRSISLGNSPAYTRRSSLCGASPRTNETSVAADPPNIHPNRSFILRKNNLMRSSRLVGTSTPNVQASVVGPSLPPSGTPSTGSNKPTLCGRKSSEMVKSEWFNAPSPSPSTPAPSSPRKFFSSTPTAPPYRSPNLSSPVSPSVLRSATATSPSSLPTATLGSRKNSSSNISSITIRSLVRKSESESPSPTSKGSKEFPPSSPSPDDDTRTKFRCGSRPPSMGVSIVLAKSNQSPLSSPKKTVPPVPLPQSIATASPVPNSPNGIHQGRSSSSTSTSSSDVFIKAENDTTTSTRRHRRIANCPSCGGSSPSGSKADKGCGTRDMWTQTQIRANLEHEDRCGIISSSTSTSTMTASSGTPVSPNIELLRHLINEQEGSRV